MQKYVKDEIADLIIADPPFNQGKDYGEEYNDKKKTEEYYQFCYEWIKLGFKALKPTGSFWIYINSKHLGRLQVIGENFGIWQNTIVWKYTNPTPDKKRFPKTWSAWLFFSKTDNFYFNPLSEAIRPHSRPGYSEVEKSRIYDVWDDISKLTGGYLAQEEVVLKPGTQERIFIYQLPERLISRIVRSCSKENDLILDMFSHSATTSIVALKLRRNSIAIEQDKYFSQKAQERIEREKRYKKMAFL